MRETGWVVRDVDHHPFTVHFDNGLIRNCTSNTLVVEDSNASLPPDLQQLSNTGGSGEEAEEEEEERALGYKRRVLSFGYDSCGDKYG